MPTRIVKGKIQNYDRSDKYDDDGNKMIHYWIILNGEKFTLDLSGKSDIYFEDHLELIIEVNEKNKAIAGLCPKKGYKWGNTSSLKGHTKQTDRFEFIEGMVQEKRKETFTTSKGTTGVGNYTSSTNRTVTYTIVLPNKNFRVAELIGKKVKPNTNIIAMLEQDVAYIIKDTTNNRVYGKPRLDYLIGLLLLAGFNIALLYLDMTDQRSVIPKFNRALLIGNIVLGIAFLISFSSYLSNRKTLRIFNQYLNRSK